MDDRILDLIKLDTLGSISEEEFSEILKAMQKNKKFPWKELGECQNLAALLSLVVKQEVPDEHLKQNILNEVKKIDKTKNQDQKGEVNKKYAAGKNYFDLDEFEDEPNSEENPDERKLKIVDHSNEFEEVKSKLIKIKDRIKEAKPPPPPSPPKKEKKSRVEFVKRDKLKTKRKFSKKSLIISLTAFVVITAAVIYFNFSGDDIEKQKRLAKKETEMLISKSRFDPPKESEPVVLIENVEEVEPEKSTNEQKKITLEEKNEPVVKSEEKVEKEDSGDEKKVKENVIEKPVVPPPESPSFIEAPLVEDSKNNKTEVAAVGNVDLKVDEIKVPPKEENVVEQEPVYFIAVEEMPEPIGGISGIQEKIKYPEIAKRAGVEGKVLVVAFVNETGDVIKAEVLKGIGLGCDEAAVNAVLQTKFKPGKQRGKSVKVKVTIPITFKL